MTGVQTCALPIWVSVILFIASVSRDFKNQTPVTEDVTIQQPAAGTLKIKAQSDKTRYYGRSWWWNDDEDNDHDAFFLNSNEDSMFLNTVRVKLVKSEDSLYHVHVIKMSRANTPQKAEAKAKNISFSVKQMDSTLILPKGFTISRDDKYRAQRVLVIVEVPNGKKVMMDKSLDHYDWFDVNYNHRGLGWTVEWNDRWDNDYGWNSNVEYRMTDDGLKRTDNKDAKIKSGKIKIDENGIEGEFKTDDNDNDSNGNKNDGYRYKKSGTDTIKIITPVKPEAPKATEKKTTEAAATESLFPFTKVIDVI